MKNYSNSTSEPCAFITKKKHRVKQHIKETEKQVFLNNGDEYEIELYNPTQNKVLAKIEIDGVLIGAGIVLRPAERVFLERHLSDKRKFLFTTYKVQGNNEEVKQAIDNNGRISVKFYQQYVRSYTTFTPINSSITINNPITWGTNTNPTYTYTTNSLMSQGISTSDVTMDSLSTFTTNSTSSRQKSLGAKLRSTTKEKKIETGRTEMGSESKQEFKTDNTEFYSYHSWISEWKILPQSQQPITSNDLAIYCTECGTKRKKDTFKFCPQCGTKF